MFDIPSDSQCTHLGIGSPGSRLQRDRGVRNVRNEQQLTETDKATPQRVESSQAGAVG